MPLNKQIRDGDNKDLTEERLKATFDTDALAAELKGGVDVLRRHRQIIADVDIRPEFHDRVPVGHQNRVEKISHSSRKMAEMTRQLADIANPADVGESFQVITELFGVEGYPLGLHWLMFVPTLQNQCDEEQAEWWVWKAMNGEILGTYAQTEMGHGTNLSKIETQATYDKKTQQFILNSPTTTSLKWWPGGLGNTVNYVVLVANLVIDSKSYGPHIFMVQIRDMETHKPLPGVRVGDIGSKMGISGVDNGYLGFDNYRIPRRHMLMKHSKVDEQGNYTKPPHAKVGYTTMMYVRAEMISHQAMYLSFAQTIAIRYACVRRQGEPVPGAGEVRILDYQTQQHRLFPGLANVFAFLFSGQQVRDYTTKVLAQIKQGDVESLADLHALSCCLKSVVTYNAGRAIEQARMSCGGHGYSDASYFPTLYGCSVGACTYEGENLVMLLQTSRYLMKAAQKAKVGNSLAPLVDYLIKGHEKHSLVGRVPQGDYAHYIADFEYVARKRVMSAFERLVELRKRGLNEQEAWSQNTVEMSKASRAHARLFIAKAFFDRTAIIGDGNVREVVGDLLHIHLNNELIDTANDLLEDGYISGDQLQYMRNDLYRLYAKLRPNASSIVDSFELSDRALRSVLGRRDGNVYDNLYQWTQQSPLNQHPEGVNPTFEKYLKPMRTGETISKL